MNQTTTPAALDLAKLEALARAADPFGVGHLITHYRMSADAKAEEAWREVATPDTILALIDLARRAQPSEAAPAACVICGADEPRTGTCGSDDSRALCNRSSSAAGSEQELPPLPEPYTPAHEAEGCEWPDAFTVNQMRAYARAAIAQRAASATAVRPLDDPNMAEYLRSQPWISTYIETLECELRKAWQAAPEASALAMVGLADRSELREAIRKQLKHHKLAPHGDGVVEADIAHAVVAAIRQLEQAAPVAPAHETIVQEGGKLICTACGTTASDATVIDYGTPAASAQPVAAAPAEPIAWMDPSAGCVMDAFLWQKDASNPQYHVPVYAAPAAPVAQTEPRNFEISQVSELPAEVAQATTASTDNNSQDPNCSCPSGNGSLAWPCSVHPPAATTASASTMHAECRECAGCGHVGINDASDSAAACHNCDWSGPTPTEDHCPGCAATSCMAAACPKCGGIYRLLAEAALAQQGASQDAAANAGGLPPLPPKMGTIYSGNYWTGFPNANPPGAPLAEFITMGQATEFGHACYAVGRESADKAPATSAGASQEDQ